MQARVLDILSLRKPPDDGSHPGDDEEDREEVSCGESRNSEFGRNLKTLASSADFSSGKLHVVKFEEQKGFEDSLQLLKSNDVSVWNDDTAFLKEIDSTLSGIDSWQQQRQDKVKQWNILSEKELAIMDEKLQVLSSRGDGLPTPRESAACYSRKWEDKPFPAALTRGGEPRGILQAAMQLKDTQHETIRREIAALEIHETIKQNLQSELQADALKDDELCEKELVGVASLESQLTSFTDELDSLLKNL